MSAASDRTVLIDVEGMTCASCVGRVEKAVAATPGVESVSVNLANGRATVRFADQPEVSGVVEAIKQAGYRPSIRRADFDLEGLSCASCVRKTEQAIQAVPGVVTATVNLASGRASVSWADGATSAADIEAAVRGAGYQAHLANRDADGVGVEDRRRLAREAEIKGLRRDLMLAAVLTLPVFIMEMGGHLIPPFHHWLAMTLGPVGGYVQMALTTLVLVGPGRRFFVSGVPAILRGAPDMNALVAVGAGAAWTYSVATVLTPQVLPAGSRHIYFEAAAVIVTLILLGRYLEARAKGSTGEAIRKLVGLQAKTARVRRGGQTVDTPINEVRTGDVIEVRPGDRVPVDGEVLDGASFVDESMISGESIPVGKQTGDRVVGGSINTTGAFSFRATHVGADTVLAQIIRMVETAQGTKLPIQARVDQITGWFVPAVFAAAALTFAIWMVWGPEPGLTHALVNAVAVLIIACPCAMGLATPTSIMVGTGRAAELGVLFRKGEALQTLRDVRIVALDKTGTLTAGRPELTDFIVAAGMNEAEALALVAAVEARSEHPTARAVVEAATARGLALAPVQAFEGAPGYGVSGEVDGRRVLVGSDRFLTQNGVDPAAFAEDAARLGAEGKSPTYVAVDGRLVAIIAVADPIKPTTPAAIRAFHDMGLKVAMISGDNRRTAEAIARRLGIDTVAAEVLPDQKVATLGDLSKDGGRIAFVGDGINDAPALAAADVGIAVGDGTDIAIESADVVLMSGDLRGVVNAIAISRATMRNIGQNLFWAFAYNAALVPVAAGLLYPFTGVLLSPMLAAGAMALSSVFVITNALRLKGFRSPMPAVTGEGA